MRRLRLKIAYDGSQLCGWQRQQNGPSVQQHLEEVIGGLVGHPVAVTGASRTDAGVHAHGQVAVCELDNAIPDHGLRRAANAALPPSIAVLEVSPAPPAWHPRFSATGKHYRYLIATGATRSPFDYGKAWHVEWPLDLARIQAALPALLGEQDFAAFRAAACDAKTTMREITALSIQQVGEDKLLLDLEGNAFLRNMVRIIVGTLVDIGRGHRDPEELPLMLASKDRTQAGQTAPPQGLYLMEVRYSGARPWVQNPDR